MKMKRKILTDTVVPDSPKNPFDEMSDATALEAAARIAETAAFNLASKLGADEAAKLIVISHQLSEVLARLKGPTTMPSQTSMMVH